MLANKLSHQPVASDGDSPEQGEYVSQQSHSANLEITPGDDEAANDGSDPTQQGKRANSLLEEEIPSNKSKKRLQGHEHRRACHRCVVERFEPKQEVAGQKSARQDAQSPSLLGHPADFLPGAAIPIQQRESKND